MNMITADQLVAHAIGDYILQSDWMAQHKTRLNQAAALHAVCYALPFLCLRPSATAIAVIIVTHFIIDRFRLARFVCWVKEWVSWPLARPRPWAECSATGYAPNKPPWLSVWLMIIADNVMHVCINGAALAYLPR